MSFDIEKIAQTRNMNIKSALESNLRQKQGLIQGIQRQISVLEKECEAKGLKLTHLRYERENIIGQIQIESLKKHEQAKEVKEQVKRIEVKKREDERAYQIA